MVSQIVPKTGLLYETPINRMLIGRVAEWSKAADHKSVRCILRRFESCLSWVYSSVDRALGFLPNGYLREENIEFPGANMGTKRKNPKIWTTQQH